MTQSSFSLDVIDVASPCSADWEAMIGDDRVRFCGDCKLNVYNLSGMNRAEAEALVNNHEGRLCVRFFRRTDGTILTKDCPIGLSAIRRRLARTIAAVAAMIGFLTFGGLYARGNSGSSSATGPLAKLVEWVEGPPTWAVGGAICLPTDGARPPLFVDPGWKTLNARHSPKKGPAR